MIRTVFLNKNDWYKAIVVGLIFCATEFCGSIVVANISIRNIVMILLTLYLCYKPYRFEGDMTCFKILIVYYIFVAVLGLFNHLYDNAGGTLVFARLLPTIIIVFFILRFIKTRAELVGTIYVVLCILIINAIITILQGVNNPLGWQIVSAFHTQDIYDNAMEKLDLYDAETTIGLSIASGLCGTVVGNGYLLGALGFLCFLPSVALFYNQQRLAFYVFLIGTAVILIVYSIMTRNYFLFAIVVMVVFLFFLFNIPTMVSKLEIGRLSNFEDEKRVYSRAFYWRNFFPDNFLLGNRTLYVNRYGQTPHFMPIETLLLGGVWGLLLFTCFLWTIGKRLIRTLYNKKLEALLFGVPIIALLLITSQHSTGFHTGNTICSYILALYLVADERLIKDKFT